MATDEMRHYNATVRAIENEVKTATAGRYSFNTKPYFSTRTITFQVFTTTSLLAAGIGYAVARAQQLIFFNYHNGSRIQFGQSQNFDATAAETNLINDRQTNGNESFAITGIGMGLRGMRVKYADAVAPGFIDATNMPQDVIDSIRGEGTLFDPASIVMPPQCQSPMNLEDGMYMAIQGYTSARIEWDDQNKIQLGTIDLFPQGGARSFLRSNGVPESSNRWRIPEGARWGRKSSEDSELIVVAQVERPVVVALNLVSPPLISPSGTFVLPTQIDLEIVCRLYGVGFRGLSKNI